MPDVRDDPMGAHADNTVAESYAGSEDFFQGAPIRVENLRK